MAYRMYVCERCGRHAVVGVNKPHSQHRTKRLFSANIQKVTMAGKIRWLCTRCIKEMSGQGRKPRLVRVPA